MSCFTKHHRLSPQRTRWLRRASHGPSPTQSVVASPSSFCGGGGISDAQAIDILRQLRVGDLRSTFAQALFPYDPMKYHSHGKWAKAVGTRVAADIRTDPQLRIAMEAAGYQPNTTGYTQQQKIILIKYYRPKV